MEEETIAKTHEIDQNDNALADFTNPSSWAVVKLPQFIILKGHTGKYLKEDSNPNDATSRFIGDDKMDASVLEMMPLSDGSMGIRSTFHHRFLADRGGRRGVGAVFNTPAELENDRRADGRFWPIKLGRGNDSGLIGLRLYRFGITGLRCFNAGPVLEVANRRAAKRMGFEVEEAVSQRQIFGLTYHMERANISEHEPLTSVTKDVKNRSNIPQKAVLSFSHTERESHSWGSTETVKMSATVEMSVRIPFVGGTDITTEAFFSGTYEWGEEQETSKQIGTQLEVEVPEMSMVQATMIVKRGKLEVPFSYGQRDTVYNGNTSLTNFADGLFSSVNTYVTYETIKRSLA